MQLKGRNSENPEVPIAPMLDMAFNLLTFFIFTFQPAPIELQFNLNLLPSTPTTQPETEIPPSDTPSEIPTPIQTLRVTLASDGTSGKLRSIRLEDTEFETLGTFAVRLNEILSDEDVTADQAEIRVDPELDYQYLIEVINLFVANKITKISFTELR